MNDNKIDKKEIIEAIEESGYLIEHRVVPVFNSFGFSVNSNEIYTDFETKKTREIDIVAYDHHLTNNDTLIVPKLLVECENNKQPVVFFKDTPLNPFMFHLDAKISGIPKFIITSKGTRKSFNDFMNLEMKHHYCWESFSTQYCSFQITEKRGIKKWMALHPENQHNTFENLIKCLDYKINEHESSIQIVSDKYSEINLYYPIIVFQGDLYESYFKDGVTHLDEINHIKYRKKVPKKDYVDTYHFDIVTERYLDEFLKLMDKEIKTIVSKFVGMQPDIERTLKTIISENQNPKRNKL